MDYARNALIHELTCPGRRQSRCSGSARIATLAAALSLLLGGCATAPPVDFTIEVPPGVTDERSRFGEIFCAVLQQHGPSLPDYRPCNEALSHVAAPAPAAARPVDMGQSSRRLVAGIVPGIGYGCVAEWLKTEPVGGNHVRQFGYDVRMIKVDALSGTAANARMIRDEIMAMPEEPGPPRLVLIGYSKGTPDILDAIVSYPEIRPHIAAVVSVAGAVGGSNVAEDASEGMADMMRFFPGAECDKGDDQAVASLRRDVRRQWMAENPLPSDMLFYSVVTLPDEARISRVLKPTYWQLSKLDLRNDSQVFYYDQIIPNGSLLAFVNADHWAVVLPIKRSHSIVGSLLVNHNDYPREALLEAILRFVEEDLDAR
jgi:hypothetical protein